MMANQQQFNTQVTEAQYQDELSDFVCLVRYFGANRVMKDIKVYFPDAWPEIYSAVTHADEKPAAALFREWD